MAQLEILVGNVGSGKSLIAKKLANKGSVVVNMDTIQSMVSGGEYGMYDGDKKDIYHEIEEAAIIESLKNCFPVCVDRTNMDIKRRNRFIEIGEEYGSDIVCYDFGEGDERGLQRRLKDNRSVTGATWEKVYHFMKMSYEKPTLSEGFSEIIIPPKNYEFHAFDFDGTIVENNFPEIGDIINGTVEKINELYLDLKNIIIIWSCRNLDYESQMKGFLLKNNIPFDFINENPMFNTGAGKIFAHKYYDDRAVTLP